MYTADAVDEELNAMAQTPGDPAEQEVSQKELKTMSKLFDKLTNLEARRRSYINSRSAEPTIWARLRAVHARPLLPFRFLSPLEFHFGRCTVPRFLSRYGFRLTPWLASDSNCHRDYPRFRSC